MSRYKIKEGRHYHSNIIQRILAALNTRERSSITRDVMFEEESWYPLSYVTTRGYNKVFGAGKVLHQQTSARYAWEPDYEKEGVIKLYSYVYERGSWSDHYLQSVAVGQWVTLTIEKEANKYVFRYPDGKFEIEHHDPSLKKILHPYHGGHDYAYRTYTIRLK